jgi:(p)ppGpp synthase/HD superfamily hydrolase
VEDQGGAAAAAEIRARFGDRVADIVLACTDTEATPKPPWRARKEAYVASVAGKSDDAILVTAADKLHNASAILEDYRVLGEALWPRFTGGRDGTLWYYRALADAIAARSSGRLSLRLARAVEDLEAVAAPQA